MNFFEQEMQKILGASFPQATYVGHACYIPLGERLRAKVQFVTCGYADKYEGIRLSILNPSMATSDANTLKFRDMFGLKPVTNPNFPQGISPHIWIDRDCPHWYVYQPTDQDYALLRHTICSYLGIFQEPGQACVPTQQLQQTM